jgi:chromosome segregation ATPase
MRYDSVNRIRHLAAIRHAKAAAARAASDDAQDARSRLGRATARRQDIEVQYHPRDAHEAVEQADADIAALREELEAAEARRQAAGQEFQAAASAHDAAVRFASEHGLEMPADDARAASAIRGPEHAGGQS